MTSIKRFLLLFLCFVTKKTDGFFVRRSEKMDHIGVTREACDSIANSVWQLATGCQCFSPKTFYFDGQRLGCMTRIDGCEVAFMKSTRKSDEFEGGSIESDDCEMKTTQISNNDGSWSKVEAEIDFDDDDTEIEFDDEDLEYDGKLIKATRPDECYTPCVVLKLQGFDEYNDNIKPTTTTTLTPAPPTPPPITTTTTTKTTKETFPPSPATSPPWTTTNSPPKTPPPITTTATTATTTTTSKATFLPSPATSPPLTTTNSPPKTPPPITTTTTATTTTTTTTTTTKATFPPRPATYPPWTTTNSPPKTTTTNFIISYPPTPTKIATTSGTINLPLGGFIAIGVVIVLLLVVIIYLFINRSQCFVSKESSRERQPAPYVIRPPAENFYETCFVAPAAQDANNELPPKYAQVDEWTKNKQPPEYAQVDEWPKNKPSNASTQQLRVCLYRE